MADYHYRHYKGLDHRWYVRSSFFDVLLAVFDTENEAIQFIKDRR